MTTIQPSIYIVICIGNINRRKQKTALDTKNPLRMVFSMLSETAEFLYKITDYYVPQAERIMSGDDSSIGEE